ncbi:MAG: HAD hydrolase-like protein [Acidobacteriota bacterium]
MRKLLLFDIDGTLVRCGQQIGDIFISAVKRTFGGYEIPRGFSFAGKTDPMIVGELVESLGLAEREVRERMTAMRDTYVVDLEKRLEARRMEILPGVKALLESLAARDDVQLALLTGNWRGSAEVKLSRFDLNRFFPFGAFGEDAADRRGLVPVAFERAREHGSVFDPLETLIIGDTALDIDCAQAAGIPCLAVATGFTDIETLRQAGATWVFEDLEQARDRFELFVA